MMVETLRVFVTVVEQSNFSRAAELLNVTQPSVSMHIRNLENEFGAKLLHRSPKFVHPTEAGKILFHHAKQILGLYEKSKEEVNQLKNIVTGNMKVGASFTIGEYILPSILAEYAGQYPFVDIQVMIGNTEEVIQAVRSNQLDIGIIEGEVNYSDVVVESFMQDEMIVVAPTNHPLAKLRIVETDMLQNQVWIFREHGSGTRSYSDRLIHELDLKVKRSFIFSSNQGVKESVASGLGLAMLSRLAVRKELEAGEITEIPIHGKQFTRSLSIIHGMQPVTSKALEVFLLKLKSLANNFAGW